MNHHVQESAEGKRDSTDSARSTKKNTGFPEPFSEDRNTTLPHPDADTSPNATIEAPDLDLTRTHSRSSFLHRNGRHHNGHHLFGRHDSLDKMYANITYADDEAGSKDHPEGPKTGDVDAEKMETNGVDGGVQSRPQSSQGEKKKGVLKKLVHKEKA